MNLRNFVNTFQEDNNMKIREILMPNEQDLAEGSAGLIGADLIRPILDQIRPSNRIIGRREPLVQGTPAAADPDDCGGN
jgi:hypothetical protein